MSAILRPTTSLDLLRALVADLEDLLQRLPTTGDHDTERAIGEMAAECELVLDPERPTVLAVITDAPDSDAVRAVCAACPHLEAIESVGPLWWAATLARQHAVGTGHAVQLIAVTTEEAGRHGPDPEAHP